MTILYPLAQIDLNTAFNQLTAQFGIVAGLLILGLWLVFLTWRNTINAKTERENARTEQIQENNKRDSLISDLAAKQGKTEDTLRRVEVELAESRGQVKLLDSQLTEERDKRQKEAIQFNERFSSISKQYEALKEEHNGKKTLLDAMTLERDYLKGQVADLERDKLELTTRIESLEAKSKEQENQIISLAEQLKALDPPHTGNTDKMKAISATIEASEVTESQKELNDKQED